MIYSMETIRKLAEIDPQDLSVVERVFGRPLATTGAGVLVLRVPDAPAEADLPDSDELPAWCNVLEGMSDQDRDDFRAILESPVRLAHSG